MGLRLTYRKCRFWPISSKIIFSDEAHFDLGGYVNKQNCLIWGTENAHRKADASKTSHVWCGFWSKGLIGPFFFENEQVELLTGNCEFLFTKIEGKNIGNIWIQKDGATCHTAKATFDVLQTVFEDRIISRKADVVWPPRSCDLIPLHSYL